MSAIPGSPHLVTDETAMFGGDGHSIATAQRMLEERWKSMFPAVLYYPLSKAVTAVGVDTEALSGEVGTTPFDPLWGEAIERPVNTTHWRQPHLSQQTVVDPTRDTPRVAADPEVRGEPRKVHMRVRRVTREEMLKKLGFDLVRTTIGCVPTTMFDRLSIMPQSGDRFRWNDEWYEVLQTSPQGWYHNTTHNLLWYLSIKSARLGS